LAIIEWLSLELNGSRKCISQSGITDPYDVRSQDRFGMVADSEDRIANPAGRGYKKSWARRSPAAAKGVELICHCERGKPVARFSGDSKSQHQQQSLTNFSFSPVTRTDSIHLPTSAATACGPQTAMAASSA